MWPNFLEVKISRAGPIGKRHWRVWMSLRSCQILQISSCIVYLPWSPSLSWECVSKSRSKGRGKWSCLFNSHHQPHDFKIRTSALSILTRSQKSEKVTRNLGKFWMFVLYNFETKSLRPNRAGRRPDRVIARKDEEGATFKKSFFRVKLKSF